MTTSILMLLSAEQIEVDILSPETKRCTDCYEYD